MRCLDSFYRLFSKKNQRIPRTNQLNSWKIILMNPTVTILPFHSFKKPLWWPAKNAPVSENEANKTKRNKARGSKKRKKLETQEWVPKSCNSTFTKRKKRSRPVSKFDYSKSGHLPKRLIILRITEFHQILLKYKMQRFRNAMTPG